MPASGGCSGRLPALSREKSAARKPPVSEKTATNQSLATFCLSRVHAPIHVYPVPTGSRSCKSILNPSLPPFQAIHSSLREPRPPHPLIRRNPEKRAVDGFVFSFTHGLIHNKGRRMMRYEIDEYRHAPGNPAGRCAAPRCWGCADWLIGEPSYDLRSNVCMFCWTSGRLEKIIWRL